MYPASIQLSNDSFHQKRTHRQEYIADDFNANTIAVRGSGRVCGDPVMTRSPERGLPDSCDFAYGCVWGKGVSRKYT